MSKNSELIRRQGPHQKMQSLTGPSPQSQKEPEGEKSASASMESQPAISSKDSGPAAPSVPPPIEHKVLRRQTIIPEEELNLHGREGWELVTALPIPHGLGEESLFFFKRRKQKESSL